MYVAMRCSVLRFNALPLPVVRFRMQHAGYNHGKLHLISVVGLNFDSIGHRLAQGMPRRPVALQVCESFEHLFAVENVGV